MFGKFRFQQMCAFVISRNSSDIEGVIWGLIHLLQSSYSTNNVQARSQEWFGECGTPKIRTFWTQKVNFLNLTL